VQPVLSSSPGTGGTFIADLDVSNWRSGGGQTYWATPAGFRDERAIGRAVYDMLESKRPDDVLYGKLLVRVVTGVSISSLLRDGGYWHQNRESAIRYGLACLTLAVQVDDRAAEEPLAESKRELAQLSDGNIKTLEFHMSRNVQAPPQGWRYFHVGSLS